MIGEEGEGIEGEGDAGTADWRVRLQKKGTNMKQHMPFRDWCAHCMMGMGRTHHHVSKKRSEHLSRRFFKPNSAVSCQTIPDESVTCIDGEGRQTPEHDEQRGSDEGN